MLSKALLMRLFAVAIALAVLFGLGAVLGLPLTPLTVNEAAACNPCDCPNDNRDNCQGVEFYAAYIRTTATNYCYIEVYRVYPEGGRLVLRVNEDTLARYPALPDRNTLIRQNQGIALYRLYTNELQINAGPDQNGKVYTMIFDGCPASTITEGSYVIGQ